MKARGIKSVSWSVALLAPGLCWAGPLLQTDFGPGASPVRVEASASGVAATADVGPVGTIDVAGGKDPSPAVRLAVKSAAGADWSAAAVVGPQTVRTAETDPRKLTLSFMASVSTLQPVTVRVESLDESGRVTGAGTAEVYPAAANFFQRYTLELSSLKADGPAFDPKSPQVRMAFGLKGEPALPAADARELRVDNVALSAPSFYVSPTGDDKADGKTEATAFATPMHAVSVAGPGDIVLLKGGEYRAKGSVIDFPRPGTPAGWITVKSAPGETPVLRTDGWHAVRIGLGSKEAPSTAPGIAYVEVRGLKVVGSSGVDERGNPTSPYPDKLGKAVAESNSNGILIEGRQSKEPVHHIRVAECEVVRCPGAGVAACYGDWVTFENNVLIDNSWFTNYATSGISILLGSQFDGTSGGYRFLVSGNHAYGNRCYQKWTASSGGNAPKKLSDGNGIIIDTLDGTQVNKEAAAPSQVFGPFTGRTLVVNNVSVNNGGSGIHLVSSKNVDLVNNTTYLNGQTPETKYSQLYGYRSTGANYVNNIVVAPAGQKYNTSSDYGEKGNTDNIWSHNLYFGSDATPKAGTADLKADPKFVHAAKDFKTADFTPTPASPAKAAGTRNVANVPVPLVDIHGKRRPMDKAPSLGAIEVE